MKKVKMRYLSALFIFLLISCTGTPAGINPVENFDLDRYLGDWYEIARLDHSFERGLDNVRASYSLNPDGSVKVINSGFSEKKKKWEEAEVFQRKMGKRITGLTMKTANDVVLGELGWVPLKARRDMLRLRYWRKILHMKKILLQNLT